MELFAKTTAIKLRSHLEKYLVADDDRETVRQSRNGSSWRAIWIVELFAKPDFIRLKNYGTGRYLTASEIPFLLGVTGKKAVQSVVVHQNVDSAEWEPVRDGFQVKLKTREGKYLRANGGTPPWRNSVTHDVPLVGGTSNWILWNIEEVDLPIDIGSFADNLSPASSFSAASNDFEASTSPSTPCSDWSPRTSWKKSGMDLFTNAKAVRLRSHHDKYLLAEEDEETVTQDRNGSSKNARWMVESVEDADNIIRLRSCYGKYLTASNQPFLLGMTGRKVLQTLPRRLDSSVEWEPIREGSQVKLRTRYGNFLRANGGVPPWRNSVTHDVPHRTATQDWVLWDIDIVQIMDHSTGDGKFYNEPPVAASDPVQKQQVAQSDSFSSASSSQSLGSDRLNSFSRQESNDSATYSPPKSDGRLIYYHIADENGEVNEATEAFSFPFKGNSVEELTHILEEETGIRDIVVCSHSPLNGKLYPLRLQLPPNNATLHLVVVRSSSIVSEDVKF
ncbi:hypothetical protein Nepgr_029457 [Nepenthes gracilis]|uniref:Actin cross-linking n=1 Tax=Nepenthes gracilis TaxID=150966 RepID=A0AAD3Y533_NEPGR|nr:hypothetical protein Nepgr_029457 [Nepenthes gracilis]